MRVVRTLANAAAITVALSVCSQCENEKSRRLTPSGQSHEPAIIRERKSSKAQDLGLTIITAGLGTSAIWKVIKNNMEKQTSENLGSLPQSNSKSTPETDQSEISE